MKTRTIAGFLLASFLCIGCGQKELPPATSTPVPDHEQMKKSMEFQRKMGGHKMPRKR